MARFNDANLRDTPASHVQVWPVRIASPAPGIAKPERRQNIQARRRRSAICCRGANQDIVDRIFRVCDLDIEEAAFERTRVPKFKLTLALWARCILRDQLCIWERGVRVTINHPHEAVRRCIVDVPIKFLDVLAVIPLGPGHAEEALLQNRVTSIPKREGETETLFEIGDAADAILAPAVRTRARVVMREIIPRLARRAVILTHCAPRPLAQVRSPEIPALSEAVILCDTALLGVHANAVQSHLGS